MESKSISTLAWIIIFVAFILGIIAGGFVWTSLGTRNPFNKVPALADQQLSIPNTHVVSINNQQIVVQDAKGVQVAFPLEKDFKALNVNNNLTPGQAPQATTLSVGDSGTLVLFLSGARYKAQLFYLVTPGK